MTDRCHRCRQTLYVYLILRKWQPTPAFLPGKSHRWRSLAGYSPWGRKELDKTGRLRFHFNPHISLVSQILWYLEATSLAVYRAAVGVFSRWTEPFIITTCPLYTSCLRVDFDIKTTHLFCIGAYFKRSILIHLLPSTFMYPWVILVPLVSSKELGFAFWFGLPIFAF